MKDNFFIDTNIFVYAKLASPESEDKREAAIRLLQAVKGPFVTSTQVLGEFSSVMIRSKAEDALIQRLIQAIAEDCEVAPVTSASIQRAWRLRIKYHFSFWDSLILASALENKCSRLYSEDFQHGQVIESSLRVINPFKPS